MHRANERITVHYATADGTAIQPSDYLRILDMILTFAPQQITQTILMTVNGDLVAEPSEGFTVSLSAPGNASISDGTGVGTIVDGIDTCTIVGTSGNDTLVGSTGDDVLCGLAGDDTLIGKNGNDTLNGGPGIDRADYSGGSAGSAGSVRTNGSNPGCTVGSGGVVIDLPLHTATGAWGTDTLVDIEGARGTVNDDLMIGNAGANRFVGDAGIDVLYGGDGDDRLEGDTGGGCLFGGSGNDVLIGTEGSDLLGGDDGNDSMNAGPTGPDALYCAAFGSAVTIDLVTRTVVGGGFTDNVAGINNVYGTAFADVIVGSQAPNELYGNGGADRIDGNDDADAIFGGPGNDELFGDKGGDTLRGGDGNDLLRGGPGKADVCSQDAGTNPQKPTGCENLL